jgi:hypothetical protein
MIPWNGQGLVPLPVVPWYGTDEEKAELNAALEHSFDANPLDPKDPEGAEGAYCREGKPACHIHVDSAGQPHAFHLCGGHDFICEKDRTVYRTEMLLYARRMRHLRLAEEGMLQECPRCHGIFLDVRHECTAEPEKAEDFPW